MRVDFAGLERRIEEIIGAGADDKEHTLAEVCRRLHQAVPHYDWVGCYLRPGTGRELILGPYEGEPTEHAVIRFGQGICGQAAERGETFLVPDVSREENYLSCSAKVRSEIVVPVFAPDGRLAGELDIDSHTPEAFTEEDRRFLESVARRVAVLMG